MGDDPSGEDKRERRLREAQTNGGGKWGWGAEGDGERREVAEMSPPVSRTQWLVEPSVLLQRWKNCREKMRVVTALDMLRHGGGV